MLTLYVPVDLGVPAIAPVDPSVTPGGIAPDETFQVKGAVPPAHVRVAAYGIPTVATASLFGKTSMYTERTYLCVAAFGGVDESSACTVTTYVSGDVGVPVMLPVALSARPGGNDPVDTLQLNGAVPPSNVNVAKYGMPTVPFGSFVGSRSTDTAIT